MPPVSWPLARFNHEYRHPPVGSTRVIGLSLDATARSFCSNKTLKGTYIYTLQGMFDGKPFAKSGMETDDGTGWVINTFTESIYRQTATSTSRYAINGQCQGTVTYSSGNAMNLYVSRSGDRFTYV
jgi:hypothetical protein